MKVSISAPELVAYSRPDHPLAGRYLIERDIGAGGMAVVFAARDLKHDRQVAIKVLRSDVGSSVNAERFTREILIAAGLTHPHILPIHDSGAVDGLLYYVMPFVEGESLAERVKREGRLPITDAIHITREIAGALQYAHDHGVVHRDVKPANVLLPGGEAVVADFGLARALDDGGNRGAERITQVGLGIGTPSYMSPEQGAGERHIDGRSDQYSLACMLYEMLTGHPPFTGDTFQKLLASHMTETPVPVRRMRPDIPRSVEDAVERALSKDPSARFTTVADFAEALESGLAHTSTSWRALSSAWDSAVHTHRGISLFVAAVIVFALVLGGKWMTARRTFAPSLDPNLVAVVPFNVIGTALGVWREGLVDVLARDYDGAGPLRSVSPSVVMRLFGTRADRTSATELARAAHAGLVLYGQLTERGVDSARASATLLDVVRDSVVGEFEVRDAVDQMDRMADSIAVQSLRMLGNRRSIAAVPRTFFGSRSLLALKAFLQGEQAYRRNDFAAAKVQYERVIATDSTFAMAYRRMRGVLRGLASEFDSVSLAYAVRAGAANRGMSPRDSMLILADSLAAVHRLTPAFADGVWLSSVRRRISTLTDAAARYPEDPEIWTELGEARAHYGERVGIGALDALQAFERALAIDSVYGPAFYHAIELTLRVHGATAALPILDRYVRINSREKAYSLVSAVLRRAPDDNLVASLDSATRTNGAVASLLDRVADPDDAYGRLNERRLRTDTSRADSSLHRLLLVRHYLWRGRMREASALLDSSVAATAAGPGYVLALTRRGAFSPARADDVFRRLRSGKDVSALPLAYSWAYARNDTTSLRLASEARDAGSRSSLEGYSADLARAYLLLARRDSAGAAKAFVALPDSALPRGNAPVRLDIARLLIALDSSAAAANYLDAHPPLAVASSYWDVEWNIERARAARRLGDARRAKEASSWAAAAWSRADPSLRTLVLNIK